MSTIEQHDGQAPPAPSDRPAWLLPAARTIPAVVVGVAVTFLQVHDARVGLAAVAVLALSTGLALLRFRGSVPSIVARFPLVAGVAGIVAGVAAALALVVAPSGVAVKVVVAAWALVSAVAEGWAWYRMRGVTDARTARLAKDWRAIAVLTLAAGVAFAALPENDVVLVGLVGAYAIVVGVFHGIAAASARIADRHAREETP